MKDYAVSSDGVRICYEFEGSGDPAIIFVHGWTCDRSDWALQLEHFAANHRVAAIDLASFGESGKDRKDYSMYAFADDVVAVADKLGLQRIVLVGHSMGGSVVLATVGKLGDRVIGVVGADTYVDIGNPLPEEVVESRLAPLRTDFAGRMWSLAGDWFAPASDPAVAERIVERAAGASPVTAIPALEGMIAFWRLNADSHLREMSVPLVAINSERTSETINRGFAEARGSGITNIAAKFIPDVGHFVMLDDPAGFNRLLEETIEEFQAGTPVK